MLRLILLSLLWCLRDCGTSGVGTDEVSVPVMEGDPVTLNSSVRTDREEITWYFNDSRIAQITGDQSKICTDDPCKERFRDRLKLDHQTGSLTITNTRNTDSGKYTLQITTGSGRTETFHVFVQVKDPPADPEQDKDKRTGLKEGEYVPLDHAVPDSGLSSGAVAGIVVAVLLVAAAAAVGVIYYRKRQGREDSRTQHSENKNGSSPNQTDPLMEMTSNDGTSPNLTDAAKETPP